MGIRVISLLILVLTVNWWTPVQARSLRDLFQQVSPSVVVIKTVQKELSPDPKKGLTSAYGLGSGVLISPDGKVMTASHVVHTADVVAVAFQDGQKISARVISSSPAADVALLQLEEVPDTAQPAILGDSDSVEPGDEVLIVGAPYGLAHTMTAGHISGRHQPKTVLGDLVKMEVLQTDAAVNKGNSGGPMFNMDGEVVGIVSHILSLSGGFEGLGFAVSSNIARRLLLDHQTPWSGLEGYFLEGELARVFNLPQEVGVLVQRVAEGSLAARLGLRAGSIPAEIDGKRMLVGGDIILEAAGISICDSVSSPQEIRTCIAGFRPGDSLTVKILRAGKIMELTSTVE